MLKLPKEIKILFKDGMGNKSAGFSFGINYLKKYPDVEYILVHFWNGYVWIKRSYSYNCIGRIMLNSELITLKNKYPNLF